MEPVRLHKPGHPTRVWHAAVDSAWLEWKPAVSTRLPLSAVHPRAGLSPFLGQSRTLQVLVAHAENC
eukprot:5567104-Prymnesium_polylepis.2